MLKKQSRSSEERISNKSAEEQQIESIHYPFYPGMIYNGHPFKAKVIFNGANDEVSGESNENFKSSIRKLDKNYKNFRTGPAPSLKQNASLAEELELPIWRISPLGVELCIDSHDEYLNKKIAKGQSATLIIYSGDSECVFTGVVVSSSVRVKDKSIIGIRWFSPPDNQGYTPGLHLEKRKHKRWCCPNEFMPTGFAHNPLRFNDFIHFQVRDISFKGMQLTTSLRNRYLIPGMIIESVISFPLISQLTIRFAIRNVRIICHNDKEFLSLGVEILNNRKIIIDAIGQYVFQFGPKTSIDELKSYGLKVKKSSSAIDYCVARTKEDYLEVLKLRKLADVSTGKLKADTTIEESGDLFDTRARIIMGRHKGEVVTTARIIFHEQHDELEHEHYVTLPDNLPPKHELAEVTRVGVHPNYSDQDLMYSLIKQVVMIVLQANRRYLISSMVPSSIPFYKRVGADPLGVYFLHGDFGDLSHELMILDIHKAISGVGVNPLVWHQIYSDLSNYLSENEVIELSHRQNFQRSLYKSLSSVYKLIKTLPKMK